MLDLRTEVYPLAHLRVRLAGHLTIETLDRARTLSTFERFVAPDQAPCTVLIEIAPETKVAPLAEGVLHYVMRRLLASTSADVRIIGAMCLGATGRTYLRTATLEGRLRQFDTLDEALHAPLAPAANPGYRLAA